MNSEREGMQLIEREREKERMVSGVRCVCVVNDIEIAGEVVWTPYFLRNHSCSP